MRYFMISLVVVLLQISGAFGQQQTAKNLTPQEFKAKLELHPDAVVLDLRTADELKHGMIPKAQHLDFFGKEFEKKINALDRSKPYFIYCASGGRSGETLELMEKKGFAIIYNLESGFTSWENHKFPISRNHKR
jgi:phage shock protein E